GTIRSNLLYAARDAGEDEIRLALEAADFAATVNALPLGLDTPVGERGLSLSGGQRQRLALARAFITEPALFLFDACTSALDAETEERIQNMLFSLKPRRTCLIVSHKVSSMRNADRIIVLHNGTIVEDGTHTALIQKGGFYADASHRQSQGLP